MIFDGGTLFVRVFAPYLVFLGMKKSIQKRGLMFTRKKSIILKIIKLRNKGSALFLKVKEVITKKQSFYILKCSELKICS